MLLSIILTVYNKEQYLRRAFESLLGQEGVVDGDYEVLVINDGSSDGSLAICEAFADIDKRVRVISQLNQGLSIARNNGIDAAQGEYVWFVDADDVVSTKSVSHICKATVNKPDIIPIYGKYDDEDIIRNTVSKEITVGKDILTTGVWEQWGVINVFRREFLKANDLRFMPGVYHEDAEFTPRMLYAAKSVKVVPEVLYTIIRDPNSITSVPRPKRAFDCLIVSESLSRFVEDKNERGTAIGRVIDGNAAVVINNGFNVIIQNNCDEQEKMNRAFYEKRSWLLKSLRGSSHLKYRIEAILFKIFPKYSVEIYKILRLFA